MSQNATQLLFSQIRPTPTDNLSERILSAIARERARQAALRARLATWSAGVWFFAFLMSIVSVGKSIIASEFWQLASLLFTDLSIALAHSEDFLFSLAETFPAASAGMLITPLFLYVSSLILRSKYLSATVVKSQFQLQGGH